ncbi:MAG: hypothetical protein LBU67_01075 [Oscillospiraceae bacterium]|nr:hypothetical protein [Oscillospiraceae bacterium]
MTVQKIATLLDARVVVADDLGTEIHSACGSDLMSDVLAFVKDRTVLLTGLINPHVIRTAEMLDITCIVFTRGKVPAEDLADMAKARGIAILTTRHTLYLACGILYQHGLAGCERRQEA